MVTMVIGASASGKSEYAESLALCHSSPRFYIATMEPFGKEGAQRIERHRKMRAGKGFQTIEKTKDLAEIEFSGNSVYLLECMGNLVANELYHNDNSMSIAYEKIDTALSKLYCAKSDIIIVTNDVFADGIKYDDFTEKYIELLAKINRNIAKQAKCAVEIVCGIPIFHKGDSNENN